MALSVYGVVMRGVTMYLHVAILVDIWRELFCSSQASLYLLIMHGACACACACACVFISLFSTNGFFRHVWINCGNVLLEHIFGFEKYSHAIFVQRHCKSMEGVETNFLFKTT